MCIIITVLYRHYAHPNCMLQSSYRWDGLNFENSCFASKLNPPTGQVFAFVFLFLVKRFSGKEEKRSTKIIISVDVM